MTTEEIEIRVQRLASVKGKCGAKKVELDDAHAEQERRNKALKDGKIAFHTEDGTITESGLKKLSTELAVAKTTVTRLDGEYSDLAEATARLESEVRPLRHTQVLNKQAEVRQSYGAVASKLLDAVNTLAKLSEEARTIFNNARSQFPKNEQCEGQPDICSGAGLSPIWEPNYISFNGTQSTRRDFVVEAVWRFDRSLVDSSDLRVRQLEHQENHMREWVARNQAEQQARLVASKKPNPHPLNHVTIGGRKLI